MRAPPMAEPKYQSAPAQMMPARSVTIGMISKAMVSKPKATMSERPQPILSESRPSSGRASVLVMPMAT